MAKSSKRKGRRARGTGSIFKSEARKVWIGRKTVGKNAKGKPIRVEVWGDTQAEVVAKLAAAVPPGPETTISQWADRWLTSLNVRPATRYAYGCSVKNHIVPTLGILKVKDVTIHRVDSFGAGLVKGGLQPTSARLVLAHLRTMLTAAVRDGMIQVNPCTTAYKPKGATKRLEPYTMPELARIIAHAPTFSAGGVIALLAACGCRIGEALGLDVPDFDPVKGTVSITKTYDLKHGLGPPKSRHSVRTIRVPASAVPSLRLAIGERTSGPLFVASTGKRRDRDCVKSAWERVCRDLKIEVRKPHQLRHSVATGLVADGAPLGDVAKFLGDTVQTIVATYSHASGTDPADALERLLGSQKSSYGGQAVGKVG